METAPFTPWDALQQRLYQLWAAPLWGWAGAFNCLYAGVAVTVACNARWRASSLFLGLIGRALGGTGMVVALVACMVAQIGVFFVVPGPHDGRHRVIRHALLRHCLFLLMATLYGTLGLVDSSQGHILGSWLMYLVGVFQIVAIGQMWDYLRIERIKAKERGAGALSSVALSANP